MHGTRRISNIQRIWGRHRFRIHVSADGTLVSWLRKENAIPVCSISSTSGEEIAVCRKFLSCCVTSFDYFNTPDFHCSGRALQCRAHDARDCRGFRLLLCHGQRGLLRDLPALTRRRATHLHEPQPHSRASHLIHNSVSPFRGRPQRQSE